MVDDKNPIFITGSAGFIGSFLVKKFLKSGKDVVGLDNLNPYYDPNIKLDRLKNIENTLDMNDGKFIFYEFNLEDKIKLEDLFAKHKPSIVINLAAQAGVRHSISNPSVYIQSNIVGFLNILECCRHYKVKNFIYASSSSVYGGNKKMPYSEKHGVDHPISLYAASKKSNELMAHTYSHLFQIPSTGLRFFTVYGPWGRPDMAPILFAKSIIKGEQIKVFNNGRMMRDFTYIDDIIESIYKCSFKIPKKNDNFDFNNPDPSISFAPHRIFNIGNNKPIYLLDFIEILEKELKIKSKKLFLPLQQGDVVSTFSDTKLLENWIGFSPKVSINYGIKEFVQWFKSYYSIL